MKKLLSILLLTVLSFAADAATWRALSFMNPKVISFTVTNGIGATNLTTLLQTGNAASATNYSLSSTVFFTYTNLAPTPWFNSTLSNYYVVGGIGLTQYGVWFPGYQVVDVVSNITSAAGVFGVLPVNSTNTTIVATNDQLNMFQDVDLTGYVPLTLPAAQGSTSTNIIGSIGLTMLNTGGNSNYVTIVAVPVVDPWMGGPNQGSQFGVRYESMPGMGFQPGYQLLAPYDSQGREITAAGSSQPSLPIPGMQAFSFSVTNWNSTVPFTAAFQVPQNYVFGANKLRIRSITAGTAAASGTAGIAITDLKFYGWVQ